MPEENSVLFAIRELAGLEEDRVAAEESQILAAAEAEREAIREAEDRTAAAQAHAQRVAEAEARQSLDRELAVRDDEAEQRMTTLRAELAAVQADRERMHTRIVTLADAPSGSTPVGGDVWGWKVAFAAAGIVAAGLAVILAVRQPVIEARIIEVPAARAAVVSGPATAPAPGAVAASAEVDSVEPVDVAALGAPPETESARGPRGRNPRTPRTPRVRMAADPLGDLDCPDDDPTCGI
ncbi:MAG: hypothetical protein JRH11_10710 [Deltaproteobacteria bacterium]|nr:hypothetical protein [Deltaproteobacteria bacterium]